MRFCTTLLSSALILFVSLPCSALTHPHHGSAAHAGKKRSQRSSSKPEGQRSIDDARATEIQGSLIRSGYLSGEPSGHWDAQTETAMQKFQSDNGWQTKLIPDSRAIIKLGLGPHNQTSETSGMASASSPTSQPSMADDFVQQ